SVIAAALEARYVSSDRAGRKRASEILSFGGSPATMPVGSAKKALVGSIRAALFASKAVSYAQGMGILKTASDKHEWNLNLGELARIWKAGCIIRAQFLGRIKEAYDRDPKLGNLLLDTYFRDELMKRQL